MRDRDRVRVPGDYVRSSDMGFAEWRGAAGSTAAFAAVLASASPEGAEGTGSLLAHSRTQVGHHGRLARGALADCD